MVTSIKKALQPLFIISKLFGICPFSLNENFSYIGSLLSIVMLVGYSSFHLISAMEALPSSNDSNFVTVTINTFNRYSGLVSIPVIILALLIHQKDVINALQLMHKVEKMFQNEVEMKIDNLKYSRKIKLSLLINFTITFTLEFLNCLMFNQSNAPYNQYCILMCLVPYTVTTITEIQFISYMELLKSRLKLINDFFHQLHGKTSQQSTKQNENLNMRDCQAVNEMFLVKEIRDRIKIPSLSEQIEKNDNEVQLHVFIHNTANGGEGKANTVNGLLNNNLMSEKIMKLHKIYNILEKFLTIIRSAYSAQIITIFTMKFSMVTSMLYACCMLLIKSISAQILTDETVNQLASSSIWIGVILFEMFAVCYVCHVTKVEAKHIGYNIHRFARKTTSQENKLHVKAFSLNLLHDRIEFIPMGFFKLDLQFLYNLFGAVSTYLIILIQFDMAQQISTD